MRLIPLGVLAMLIATSCTSTVGGAARITSAAPSVAPSTPASATPTTRSPAASTRPHSSPSLFVTPTPSATITAHPGPGYATWLGGQQWNLIPTTARVVALTFDAGGDDAGVPSILATLAREHVTATFFLTGNFARTYPSFARTIAATYRIGNHTMTHPHLTSLSDAEINAQIVGGAATIRATCQADPAPLFRFPYGDHDAHTIALANAAGFVDVGWTVDTLGWEGISQFVTINSIVNRVVANAQPGEIVLMHVGANPGDGSTLDAAALPFVIKALRDRGYGFVSLDALLTARA